MRGVGGPLLCIGDLLSDVGDDVDGVGGSHHEETDVTTPFSSSPSSPVSVDQLRPSDLHQLFEETYDKLVKSLEGNDHSWTVLTLKLCVALKTADKLVSSTNSNVGSLLQKVEVLESILKRGDSAIETAKSIQTMLATKSIKGMIS